VPKTNSSDWQDQLRHPNSGLWDTRAPYAFFLRKFESINRFYRATRIAYAITAHSCETSSTGTGDLTTFLTEHAGPKGDRRDISKYARYVQSVEQLNDDLNNHAAELNRITIVRLCSLFEEYTLCWVCNMLLAILESEKVKQLSDKQIRLAEDVAGRCRLPQGGVPAAIRVFGDAKVTLSSTARRRTHPQTGQAEEAAKLDASAEDVVEFWRQCRNILVHSDSQLSKEFVRRHTPVWDTLREDLRGVPALRRGAAIPLPPVLVTAAFTNHQRLALAMRDVLISFSGEKRGHVYAPGPFRGPLPPDKMPEALPPLRAAGDW
jgi:hypothetical protein